MKKHKKIIFLVVLLLIIGLSLFGFFSYKNVKSNEFKKFIINDTIEVGNQEEKDIYKEEITSLQNEYNNQDVVGTIEIENTDYKVPIVQGNDNKFYLSHLPNKEYSIMGSIFLDYRVNINASRKLLIYGHNSKIYDMPFKILENYYDIDYLNSHKYVDIKTKEKVKRYEIFSLYVATSDYKYMNVKFTDSEYQEHVKYLQDKSMYEINTNLDYNDDILILQTCSTHKDYLKYKKKYLVIAFHEVNVKESVN
ncbi:MAG: class B sortase [Bacilli bacterium]|nr:class B sortase [Bacilli bacterium]